MSNPNSGRAALRLPRFCSAQRVSAAIAAFIFRPIIAGQPKWPGVACGFLAPHGPGHRLATDWPPSDTDDISGWVPRRRGRGPQRPDGRVSTQEHGLPWKFERLLTNVRGIPAGWGGIALPCCRAEAGSHRMRWKIIIVNAGIVAIVGALSFALLFTSLSDILTNPGERKADVERAIRTANAQLALDGLRLEHWLSGKAKEEGMRSVFTLGTAQARSAAARSAADRLKDAAVKNPDFRGMTPSLVLFIDAHGIALGRNGSSQMRGDKTADAYKSLKRSLSTGKTASDIWVDRTRNEQMLASYSPVEGEDGDVVGALVVGTPLNDERLSRTRKLTSGIGIALATSSGGAALEVIARAGGGLTGVDAGALGAARSTLVSGRFAAIPNDSGMVVGAAPLSGYGSAVLLAAVPASLVHSIPQLLWPIVLVAMFGMLLVAGAGGQLGNFISQPVAELEEGLLQIINGKTELRFELEHPDLGGLIFRINSLLNALMGVPETDDEGRTSQSPPAGG